MTILLQTQLPKAACLAVTIILSQICVSAAATERYPNKPIRVIVPSAPSSGPDIVTRLVGSRLTEAWGQHVVVDARPGAAGNIASELAARATPDGYTLLMATSQQISGPLFFEKLAYNLIKDFLPIALIASTPYVLSVHPSVAPSSVKELIALAKARPGTLHYGSSGVGGAPFIAAEMLKAMTGIDLVHVPYRSVVFALVDVVAGQIQLAFSVMPAALPMVKQGKLKALGVTGLKRTPLAPELETIAETVPGYEYIGWYGLVAPNQTPDRIITALHAEVVKVVRTPDVKEKLAAMGAEPIGTTPREFSSFMTAQREKLRKTIQAAGLRAN